MNFGKYLKEERVRQGKSQQQLAEDAGVTKRAVAYWESGKRKMNIESADKVFRALHISVVIGDLHRKNSNILKGWILCNEQMPDTEESVLLSLRNLDICVGFNANTERRFYVVGDGYVEYENVLAGQPLPEPYKS